MLAGCSLPSWLGGTAKDSDDQSGLTKAGQRYLKILESPDNDTGAADDMYSMWTQACQAMMTKKSVENWWVANKHLRPENMNGAIPTGVNAIADGTHGTVTILLDTSAVPNGNTVTMVPQQWVYENDHWRTQGCTTLGGSTN